MLKYDFKKTAEIAVKILRQICWESSGKKKIVSYFLMKNEFSTGKNRTDKKL
jgi:hypothetical protein